MGKRERATIGLRGNLPKAIAREMTRLSLLTQKLAACQQLNWRPTSQVQVTDAALEKQWPRPGASFFQPDPQKRELFAREISSCFRTDLRRRHAPWHR